MPASEAQVAANRLNASKSRGPKTAEGKARSRCNALKHGLTGEGVVLPDEDATEVERMARELETELRPSGPLGKVLVRRVAILAVRMDRCVDQETAALSERVRRAETDFDAALAAEDDGDLLDEESIARGRAEAARRAMFDPSREAILARKYEAAAERSFFRALKEFRQVEREAKATAGAPVAAPPRPELGSFFPGEVAKPPAQVTTSQPPLPTPRPVVPAPSAPARPIAPPVSKPRNPAAGRLFDIPFTIGRVG